MIIPYSWDAWAIKFVSVNELDGRREGLQGAANLDRPIYLDACRVMLFSTRQEAREYAKGRWGYIKERKDLQREPHGWRMPKAVKVRVTVDEVSRCE